MIFDDPAEENESQSTKFCYTQVYNCTAAVHLEVQVLLNLGRNRSTMVAMDCECVCTNLVGPCVCTRRFFYDSKIFSSKCHLIA